MSRLMTWEDADNPVHVLSLGAGRQSSVMYLMACDGLIDPMPDVAIFADTGNEPQHVYDQLDYLREYGHDTIPIEVVDNGNIYSDSLYAMNGGTPWGTLGRWVGPPVFSENGGPIRRKCTQQYKIKPKEARAKILASGRHIVDWRGHTTDELHRAKPDKRKQWFIRWPLLEERMSTGDCAGWLEAHGHPPMMWSACLLCPFRLRQKTTSKWVAEMYPDDWQNMIVPFDGLIRDMSKFGLDRRHYLNADYLPMDEFLERGSNQMSLFDCDGGQCGL